MDNTIINAIEVFKNRIKEKEDELNRLKKAVNDMAKDAGLPSIYASVASETTGSLATLRADIFYGQPLLTAIRTYLDMRKASGLSASSSTEIYEAVKAGGYKFDTNGEENAKTGVRNALRKNSAVFHRLPNGDYGLLAWYPNAKAVKNGDDDHDTARTTKEKTTAKEPAPGPGGGADAANYFSYDEIREAIYKTTGNFFTGDIERTLTTAFPSKTVRRGSIPTTIFLEKKKGKLKIVAEKQGNKGAMYCKV
jgi:hypothetical protein